MPDTQWQKSSFSGVEGPNCVELARVNGHLLLRESDDPDTVIATTPARLNALVRWQKSRRPGGSR
ncbi:DUF397 domain-containing protein [Streptomyces sp. PA5.6]|uniref:DUF397 domain-containing protein n=2 Tax=Streptomyces venezuelae TaxID=54571 RepID=A0A5P2CHM0_STRVZ|nr:DUF397 domain-containing protein [Streptomyces venezuelae]